MSQKIYVYSGLDLFAEKLTKILRKKDHLIKWRCYRFLAVGRTAENVGEEAAKAVGEGGGLRVGEGGANTTRHPTPPATTPTPPHRQANHR